MQEKSFDWIRGYQVGGKSLLWARQTQRWSKYDFEGPARDGFAVDWPIRYDDLAPWYSYVERFVGISGNKDGLDTLPDGEFLPPWEMNVVEKAIRKRIVEAYQDRPMVIGRCAHLTKPEEIHRQQGGWAVPGQDAVPARLPLRGLLLLQLRHPTLGRQNRGPYPSP